ncbi:MAG TPA: hypothetical protein VN426_17865 [Syntrophomonadaceae bacterium]|nr:hypothetical protein [Syntrophomonadaceae bacterium]
MILPFEYRNLPWRVNNSGVVKSGQVLVRMEWTGQSWLDLHNWDGSNLPAHLISVVLKIVLGAEWAEKLEKLHLGRKSKWKVEVYSNPEEAKEYRLYKLDRNKPACSSAVTICSGLIGTFSIRTEDAAPLLKKFIEDYPPEFMPLLRSKRYNYFFPTHFPGNAKYKSFAEVPEPIKMKREETERIKVAKDSFLTGVLQAGESSEIIETIEALKCLEVLMA